MANFVELGDLMKWRDQKVLVTGGAGFIGGNLVKRLVTEGANVSVVDNLWRGNLSNLFINGKPLIDIENYFFHEDLTNYAKCVEIIRDYDFVIHLADVVAGIGFSFQNEYLIFQKNILINTNVLNACLLNGIANYIYVGTACSYPEHLQREGGISAFREDQAYPASPESSYGWSKLMGEYEAELAMSTNSLSVGILRFHNVYGPGISFDKQHSQVLPSLIYKAIKYPQEPFIVWGSGNQYRDFVYVDDAVDALIKLAERGMNKGVIQIGSEKATTIREAANLIIEISGKPIQATFDESKPEGDFGRISICSRARNILEWDPTIDLRSGLEATYVWIEKNLSRNRK